MFDLSFPLLFSNQPSPILVQCQTGWHHLSHCCGSTDTGGNMWLLLVAAASPTWHGKQGQPDDFQTHVRTTVDDPYPVDIVPDPSKNRPALNLLVRLVIELGSVAVISWLTVQETSKAELLIEIRSHQGHAPVSTPSAADNVYNSYDYVETSGQPQTASQPANNAGSLGKTSEKVKDKDSGNMI